MVISRWFRCCAKLSIDFLKVSSWPNENFISAVKNIVAILADLPNTTLTDWKTAKAPKTESAKVQPLMLRIRKFSIRWNPLESRCSRIEQDKTGQWKRPSGPKGRRFKSCHLDQKTPETERFPVLFYSICTKACLWYLFLATILQPFKMYQKAARINMLRFCNFWPLHIAFFSKRPFGSVTNDRDHISKWSN